MDDAMVTPSPLVTVSLVTVSLVTVSLVTVSLVTCGGVEGHYELYRIQTVGKVNVLHSFVRDVSGEMW